MTTFVSSLLPPLLIERYAGEQGVRCGEHYVIGAQDVPLRSAKNGRAEIYERRARAEATSPAFDQALVAEKARIFQVEREGDGAGFAVRPAVDDAAVERDVRSRGVER